MNTALQSLLVETPKVQDYFGDLFSNPLRIFTVVNYLIGIFNRFADGDVDSPSSMKNQLSMFS